MVFIVALFFVVVVVIAMQLYVVGHVYTVSHSFCGFI